MLCRGGSVTLISCIKKNKSKPKQTNSLKTQIWKPYKPPKHYQPKKSPGNKQTSIMCKGDFNVTTGIWTFPSPPYKISICWFEGRVLSMCRILKNIIASLQSRHASNNKLPSICLFMSTKAQFFCHVDWSHILSKPVQVIPKCPSRIKLLHRDHFPLSKVQHTNLAIKSILFRVISLGFCV